ncbi:AAA-domain-containing protein [Rhizoclosmatium globosum]|uniref:AAA-domain-containing protein n=1 Tax=Rhizoclosmatium globosum TaxID=329046 RepID=A0A1Y2BEC2_9FUNG|nr:AAA-domain-containing protein [Rhizoclosmatium globosum]|eukprot:ORY32425.1 AAA-domain-containing protein [Rhizoclosmatium globosum]
MAATRQLAETHMRQVISSFQREFALSGRGQSMRKTTPLRFKAMLNDEDALVDAAKDSNFHDLRRMGKKELRRIVASLLAGNEDFLGNALVQNKANKDKGNVKGENVDGGDSVEEEEEEDEDSDEEDDDSDNEEEVDEEDLKKLKKKQQQKKPQQEPEDSDSIDDDNDEIKLVTVKNTNTLNRSLIGVYAKSTPPVAEDSPASKKRSEDSIEKELPAHAQERIRRIREANGSSKRRKTAANKGSNDKDGDKAIKKALEEGDKYAPPKVKLQDLGGIDGCIEEVLQLIGMPLKHPEIYLHLGIQPPRGILLHGPPGCGKSMLANAIAGESQVPFIQISAPSIVSGMSGESEKKVREIFEEAKTHAPCILFIDEIDAITPKRETAQREMERRIVAQLLTCMDDVSLDKTDGKPVLVIGATNRPDSLDPALRRAGRFDREISMGVPDEAARMKILEKLCSKLRLDGQFDFKKLAKQTPGYVGADLNALTSEAGMVAVRRIFKDLSHLTPSIPAEDDEDKESSMDIDSNPPPSTNGHIPPTPYSIITRFLGSRTTSLTEEDLASLAITHDDFLLALEKVQPSSKREGFATIPDVTWNDVGALGAIRDELKMSVVEPIKHPELFARVGITKPMGVLLYGPPGCGKTMLAKAVASESCCNFISVKGPELLNKFVGESERGVRMVFSRAASSAPCVIFFDELDALCPARSNDSESQSSSRLVNTLLTEMDGMNNRSQVYIIAATNRPDMIDPAMLRPGRLDKTLYVDLPTPLERFEILKTISRKTPIAPTVCLETVAKDSRCEGFSGADLAALVREAAVAALRGSIYAKNVLTGNGEEMEKGDGVAEGLYVTMENFGVAFSRMAASVSKRDRKKYELLKVKFSGSGVAGPVVGSNTDDA